MQNERDRHMLAWLRALVGDAAIAQAAQRPVEAVPVIGVPDARGHAAPVCAAVPAEPGRPRPHVAVGKRHRVPAQ